MLNAIQKLEDVGEVLRANIRYDLPYDLNFFDFIITKIQEDNRQKSNLEKALNRKITEDDKL